MSPSKDNDLIEVAGALDREESTLLVAGALLAIASRHFSVALEVREDGVYRNGFVLEQRGAKFRVTVERIEP